MRVVFGVALATSPVLPVAAQTLPYEIANFFQTRSHQTAPEQASVPAPAPVSILPPAPQIAYDVDSLLFNRVPDHISLAYQMRGLTDYVPQYRDGRDVRPLTYDFEQLVGQAQSRPGVAPAIAGSP